MIGGFAYNLYQNPRMTGDIDFLVELSPVNEMRLRGVLKKFGFSESLPPENQVWLTQGKVVMLGRAPHRIDILTKIDGVDFEECYKERNTFVIDELEIPVISLKKLIKNKKSTGRKRDLADAEMLSRVLGD